LAKALFVNSLSTLKDKRLAALQERVFVLVVLAALLPT
jgi:hypothetical protein